MVPAHIAYNKMLNRGIVRCRADNGIQLRLLRYLMCVHCLHHRWPALIPLYLGMGIQAVKKAKGIK